MDLHITQTEWNGSRIYGMPVDHILSVRPEPGWPNGRRGNAMFTLWDQIRIGRACGVLWIDPDIAADRDDLDAMREAVAAEPGMVHTGWVKLWPASTGRPDWIWSHRTGSLGDPQPTQDRSAPVAYVSNGFLWTPRELLELAWPAMPAWKWADIDIALSELALANDIPLGTVAGCEPKHLHY